MSKPSHVLQRNKTLLESLGYLILHPPKYCAQLSLSKQSRPISMDRKLPFTEVDPFCHLNQYCSWGSLGSWAKVFYTAFPLRTF